ncbi:hypothetical protein EDD36DRAFT_208855 [Exophiala viscosa]|uniref:Uncharacterized protein n=1 Tax=Exophiala viscosa TaxID=2486360 RepID=A0AAN6DZQ2_9EURO|nr:hypothetical protein EDD36DRAFT_208855 [Exophiala viscosa]
MASTKSAIPLFIFLAILLLLLPCAAVQYIWYPRLRRRQIQGKSRFETTDFSTSIELQNMRPPPPAVPALPARSTTRARPLPLVFRGVDGKFIVGATGTAQPAMTAGDEGQTVATSDKQSRKSKSGTSKSKVQTTITNEGHVRTTITYNGQVVVQKTTTNEEASARDVPTGVKSGPQDSVQPVGLQHASFAEAKPFFLQPAPAPKRKQKTSTTVLDVPKQKPSLEAAPRVKSHVAKPEEAVFFEPEDGDVGYDTEAQVPRGWI